MDRREIEVFVTVMQLGSVSAAARALDMAQPSVSKAIAMIERRHNIALFERERRRLRPTEAARQLIDEATRLDQELSRFDRYVDNVRDARPGLIRMAATPSLSLGALPVIARRFREAHGEKRFILDMHPNHDIVAAVERRQYDAGLLVHVGEEVPAGTTRLADGQIVCVMQDSDPLAGQTTISTDQIAGRDLISITTDMRIVAMLTSHVPGFEERSSRSLETNRYNIAVNLVRQGMGITLVDEFTLFGGPTEGLCIRPLEPRLGVSLLATVAEPDRPRRELRALLDVLRGMDFRIVG